MRRFAPLLVLVALALPAPAAAAQTGARGGQLWATIDECGSHGARRTVGILGEMSGDGDGAVAMYIRFQLEYLTARHRWAALPGIAARFEPVGSGATTRSHGTKFELSFQRRGHFTLRAAVTYQWRRDGRVISQHARYTTAGHSSRRYGLPLGFSAATCIIS